MLGDAKSIDSDSRSGILDNGQEKVIEKTTTKLSLMLAMFHVVRMADAMAIESSVLQKNRLRGNLIIFSRKRSTSGKKTNLSEHVARGKKSTEVARFNLCQLILTEHVPSNQNLTNELKSGAQAHWINDSNRRLSLM